MRPRDAVAVLVANGQYATKGPLETVVDNSRTLADILTEQHGFTSTLLPDLLRGDLLLQLEDALKPNVLPKGSLIVVWTGHGERGPDGGLRLMGRVSPEADGKVTTAGDLLELATLTGAQQVLVVLDTCYAGGGMPSAYEAASAVLAGRVDQAEVWVGVLAACQRHELSRSGALAREFARVLSEGPRLDASIVRWQGPLIRGDELIDTVIREWEEPRQSPSTLSSGSARELINNQLYRKSVVDQVVDHLLQASRGTSTESNYFTGRISALTAIVRWLDADQPGLFVVTGPPGSGKSGVLGRLVSLSSPAERAHILADRPAPPPECDPGVSRVDAHLHARGESLKTASTQLSRQLGLDISTGPYGVLAHASARRAQGHPLVVVFDGLDEAGTVECRKIAVQLIAPLQEEALVLVGTRELPGDRNEPSLLALLGSPSDSLDLGQDVEGTLDDVESYVHKRLAGVRATMDPQLVGSAVRRIAAGGDPSKDGPFLLARLITAQLRASPVDTRSDGWEAELSDGVGAALDFDLASMVMEINEKPEPTAARELLHALAYAHGSGLPADDLWPAVATALSPLDIVYSRDDVYDLLMGLGRHVVMSTERDQVVYRVAHQLIVDHLRPEMDASAEGVVPPEIAEPIAEAVVRAYHHHLDLGLDPEEHAYLWLHAWHHCADAELPGIELLRALVEREPDAFQEDLALALSVAGQRLLWTGSPNDGVPLLEEAVEIRRGLGNDVDLILALHELALLRSSAGDTLGSEELVVEGTRLARRAGSDPQTRGFLASALVISALIQLRSGSLSTALTTASEAVGLAEQDLPDSKSTYAGANSVGALAAMVMGNVTRADELSKRALEIYDERAENRHSAARIECLTARTRVDLLKLVAGTPPPTSADLTGLRVLEIFSEICPTSSVLDVSVSEGMRLLAYTIAVMDARGLDVAGLPSPAPLLDDAIELSRPLAASGLDAAVVVATAILTRARIAITDAQAALADLDEAAALVRPHAEANAMARVCLGELQHGYVLVALGAGGSASDLLERQYEAATMLSTGEGAQRQLYGNALGQLRVMLSSIEADEQTAAVIDLQVDLAREVEDPTDDQKLVLVFLLSDLASLLIQRRPVESAAYAREALDTARTVDASDPRLAKGEAFCQLNLGAALMNCGRSEDAREAIQDAVNTLETIATEASELPVKRGYAIALLNSSVLNLEAGDAESARIAALRACDVASWESLEPWIGSMGIICRHRAQVLLKQPVPERELAGIIQAFEDELDETKLVSFIRLGFALNAAGPEAWDETLARLDDHAELRRWLILQRTRPANQLELLVKDLAGALDSEDLTFTRAVREVCRVRRSGDIASFDQAWEHSVGPVPDWLQIDPKHVMVVVAWLNAERADRAHDIMRVNPILLSPLTDVAIDEFSWDADDELRERWSSLKELRQRAVEDGVDDAYRPELASMHVADWLADGLSETHLATHRDDLLSSDVAAWLSEDDEDFLIPASMLVLVRLGEEHLAYRIKDDGEIGLDQLKPAWRSDHHDRLAAIGLLSLVAMPEGDERWRDALLAAAMGRALGGREESAVAFAEEAVEDLDDGEARERLLTMVGDALTHHPDAMDRLQPIAALLRAS